MTTCHLVFYEGLMTPSVFPGDVADAQLQMLAVHRQAQGLPGPSHMLTPQRMPDMRADQVQQPLPSLVAS